MVANDTIPAGETVSVTLPSTTVHGGTLNPDTNHDGGFTYTPATGYVGTDTFIYTITTTNGKTATAIATITVNAANPTATADTYASSENTGLTINQASGLLSNDLAPAGEALTLSLPLITAHGGTLIPDANNGRWIYLYSCNRFLRFWTPLPTLYLPLTERLLQLQSH